MFEHAEGGCALGFEQEAFHELMSNIWGRKSQMQEEMSKGAKGEPFIVQELSLKGPQTPTQLAAAMRATTGRVSTLLSALERKGQVTREVDPNDRRIVHVSLTEEGQARAKKQREDMREAICWIFSQMGERRTREFVDLVVEFTTYMSLCVPGKTRPTPEQVREAFRANGGSAGAD
jgi:MarR family transcriptional regulator, 2-MHQ and catechol-resistance regulon repressor